MPADVEGMDSQASNTSAQTNGHAASQRPKLIAQLHRRIFHICAASLFPTLILFLPKTPVLTAAVALAAAAVTLDIVRLRAPRVNDVVIWLFRPLIKERERTSPFASTYLLVAAAIVIAVFDKPQAVLAMYFLSLGDPAAAIVGERIRGHRTIDGKSLEGSAAFFVASLAIGSLLLETGLDVTYPVMMVGAAGAMLAELWPPKVEDNFKVPLIAGGVLALTNQFW